MTSMGSMQGRSGLSARKRKEKKKKNGRLLAFGCFLHGYQSKRKQNSTSHLIIEPPVFRLGARWGWSGVRGFYAVAEKAKTQWIVSNHAVWVHTGMQTCWHSLFKILGSHIFGRWSSVHPLCWMEFWVERGHPILKRDDKFQPGFSPLSGGGAFRLTFVSISL